MKSVSLWMYLKHPIEVVQRQIAKVTCIGFTKSLKSAATNIAPCVQLVECVTDLSVHLHTFVS